MKTYSSMKEVPPHLFSRTRLYKKRLRPNGEAKARVWFVGRYVDLFDIKETVQVRTLPKESRASMEKKRIETSRKKIQKMLEQAQKQNPPAPVVNENKEGTVYKIYGFFKIKAAHEGRVYVAIKADGEKEFLRKVKDEEYEYDFSSRNLILETKDKEKVAQMADLFFSLNTFRPVQTFF